jgi:hypothetical protein
MLLFQFASHLKSSGSKPVEAAKPTEDSNVLTLGEVQKIQKDDCWKFNAINEPPSYMNSRLPKFDDKLKEQIQTAARARETKLGCPVITPPAPTPAPDNRPPFSLNPNAFISWAISRMTWSNNKQ